MDDKKQDLINWILKIAVGSLASIMIAVVLALLIGIFMPNDLVDNKDIFAIIGPAFNTVIGAFVGLLGGLSLSSNDKKEEPPAPEEPVDEIA